MERIIIHHTASARPGINWNFDITIAYLQGKPIDLPTMIMTSRLLCHIVRFDRLFPSSVIPRNSELLSKWVYERWKEKQNILASVECCRNVARMLQELKNYILDFILFY
ncbi:hypothetical protein PV325_007014 [Microctonus aethiopoides]|nr:hypothetical protein PV325_007014 [Microctonus aethiopoides]KAK0079666.1 hypothetical protein PV326_008609 [Microctonus aethiopoides]